MSNASNRKRAKRPPKTHPSLLTWRLSFNLSQREAAHILGITQQKYSRLERGIGIAVRDEARTIRERTGVPIEVLTGAA